MDVKPYDPGNYVFDKRATGQYRKDQQRRVKHLYKVAAEKAADQKTKKIRPTS